MQRSEISRTFTLDAQGPGCGPQLKGKEFESMKKIFKNLAKHFALYGQRMTENLGL